MRFFWMFTIYSYSFKFESNWNLGTEKEKQLKLFDKITSNKDKSNKEKLNIEKAANKHNRDEDIQRKSDG